jgi:hypothetical protein
MAPIRERQGCFRDPRDGDWCTGPAQVPTNQTNVFPTQGEKAGLDCLRRNHGLARQGGNNGQSVVCGPGGIAISTRLWREKKSPHGEILHWIGMNVLATRFFFRNSHHMTAWSPPAPVQNSALHAVSHGQQQNEARTSEVRHDA